MNDDERDEHLWKCDRCLLTLLRKDWPAHKGILCCGGCLLAGYPDTLICIEEDAPR